MVATAPPPPPAATTAGASAGDLPFETVVTEVSLFGSRGVAGAPSAAPQLAEDDRPYRFTGAFAGMVFKHGSELRNFFSAVQKELPVEEIARLVGPVLASPAAKAKLADLALADRAIFDAMAVWAKAHGL